MKALNSVDIASGKYSIFDVVLPVPGYSTVYPEHAAGRVFVEGMLAADGLSVPEVWQQRAHRDLSLSGTYRPLLNKALDVSWSVVTYTDPTVRPLVCAVLRCLMTSIVRGCVRVSSARAPTLYARLHL